MSVSAIFTPAISKGFSNATYGGVGTRGKDQKEPVIMSHDSGRHLASNQRYKDLCAMSDGIVDDEHKESLAGVPAAFEYGCGIK